MLFWKGEAHMSLTGAYPYDAIMEAIAENWPRGAGSAPAT
jgi:hypothetical protein